MNRPRRRYKLLLAAHPLRTLIETWGLGLLILFPLSQISGQVSRQPHTNAILMVCGACGIWMVIRTRVPQGHPLLQTGWELGTGVALSVLVAELLPLSTNLLNWPDIWQQSTLNPRLTSLLLVATGPGYLIARIGVRLWLFWDRMRRRRLDLSLTHAHLAVAATAIALLVVLLTTGTVLTRSPAPPETEGGSLMALVADRLYLTVMPLFGVSVVMTLLVLLALLPPSAAVSYIIARQTTRRLKELTEAARAIRQGDYGARVDVTGEDEIAQLQADFDAMAAELEQTLHTLEAQRDTVSQLLKSRRELVASVSHELRTPVATARATLESVLARTAPDLSPELAHDLDVVREEMLQLQRLIDDLFTLSRADVEQLTLDCQPTDVRPLIERAVETMVPLAWKTGRVEVVAEIPAELGAALVDGTRLDQVLSNLVRNAIRHTPPGGIVAITAAAEEKTIRIDVCDTGEGIPPHELPHIWERFYRGESAREDGHGAGLGLALVKEMTEAMGGSVSVQSEPGEGACFSLRFLKSVE